MAEKDGEVGVTGDGDIEVQTPPALSKDEQMASVECPDADVCAACTSVVEGDPEECPRCHAERPPAGWISAAECGDRWLACIIDDTFQVISLIGEGAVGRVYEAESLTVSRSFALKIVDLTGADTPEHSGESVRDQLQREIEAQSTLRNPHIVPLFDALPLPDNRVAMVMNFTEGQTLRELVAEEGPLPIERACSICRQAANGLQEAHEAGMIHRDLKPDNIMVEDLPAGDDFVHVFDFGVVSVADDTSRTQGFVGTPLYASPEQACGEELDRRSDIYALGAVLFCMLTGRPPFVTDDIYEALDAHINQPPPKLGQALPSRLFPDRLEDLVACMLAKDPSDRPATMAALISELDALAANLGGQSAFGADSAASLEERSSAQTIVPDSKESVPVGELSDDPPSGLPEQADPIVPGAQILSTPDSAMDRRTASAQSQSPDLSDLPVDVLERHTSGQPRNVHWAISATGRIIYVDERARLHLVDDDLRSDWTINMQLEERPTAVALADNVVYLGTSDGRLVQWHLESSNPERLYERPAGESLASVAVDQRASVLALTSSTGEVRCARLDAPQGPVFRRIDGGGKRAIVDVAGDASHIAIVVDDRELGIYVGDWPHDQTADIDLPFDARMVRLSHHASLVACVSDDDELRIWKLPSGEPVSPLRVGSAVAAVGFSPDDQIIILRAPA